MSGSILLRDLRIFTGESTIENGYVLVESGQIKAVGNVKDIASANVPAGITTWSKPGHTVLPGFIDAHVHADKGNPLAIIQSLRFGVTTVMDMHNEPHNIHKLKKMAAESKDVSDIKASCLAATIDNGWPIPVVTAHDKSPQTLAEVATWPKLKTDADVEAFLEKNKADGCDYIKLMHESGASLGQSFVKPDLNLQATIIKGAHARGFKTVCHALAREDTIQILEAGIDGLTHTFFDQPPNQALIDAYKKNNAWLNPTLAAIGTMTGEGKETQERFAHDKRVSRHIVEETEREKLCQCMNFCAETSRLEYAYESVRQLHAAGIDIICGSDSAGPLLGTTWGPSLHHELFVLVTYAGLSPEQALKSATSVTARRFGWQDRGSIAQGLKGDLVLVEGNPLADINDTLNLKGVWRDGVLSTAYQATF